MLSDRERGALQDMLHHVELAEQFAQEHPHYHFRSTMWHAATMDLLGLRPLWV